MRSTAVAGLTRAEATEIRSVEYQADVFAGGAGSQGVLPTIVGDGSECVGVPERPAQGRPDIPAGGEVVPLLRVHVDVAAMHRDHAGHPKFPGSHDRGWSGWNGPMRVDHVGTICPGLSEGRP